MQPDLWKLYANMVRSRTYENAISELWDQGLISGEMHLGTGEEGIVAGVLAHLQEGDALALDHRCTPPLLMRGVDPLLIIRELLGHPGGLGGGKGGHMHLLSREHLAASSGVIGSPGPTAVGFALAARYLRPGTIAVAFFGEGAMNQGMLMESMNLAAAWNLPVLFVCKDDDWSITTPSTSTTGGLLTLRAQGLGLKIFTADGRYVSSVWNVAQDAIVKIREENGPAFLYARCVHIDTHFLGFQLTRVTRSPFQEIPGMAPILFKSSLKRRGASLPKRLSGWKIILEGLWRTWRNPRLDVNNDPVYLARQELNHEPSRLAEIESTIQEEVNTVISTALLEVGG